MNKKLTKVISLILSCLLLIGAAVGITVSANSEEATASVEIANKNVAYEGAVQIVYALKVENAEGLTAKVVFPKGDYTVAEGVDVDEISEEQGYVKNVAGTTTKNDVVYSLVFSNGIVAKELRKEVVATPVLVDADGVVKYVGTTSREYSPYRYAMNRFDNAQSSAAQIELYKALLDYGAAVQDLLSDNYVNLGFASKEDAISAWGDWADEYYNATYTDQSTGNTLTYKRAATSPDANVVANKLAENKIFLGFFDGDNQVYKTGVTSSTWNEFDIKPGSVAKAYVAKFVDGTNPYEQFTDATALPDWAYLNYGDGNAPAEPVENGAYGWFEDGIYKVGKKGSDPSVQHLFLNPVGTDEDKVKADTYKAAGAIAAESVNYELDIRLDSAENIRPKKDNIIFYVQLYSTDNTSANRPGSFTHYYDNESWQVGSTWVSVGEWVNLRFEFVQHETLPGYLCNLYLDGKLAGSVTTTGYTLPVIALESRYAHHDGTAYTEYSSDIFYSVDNLRAEYVACTEHEWVEVEHSIYKKSDPNCCYGTLYYKSCANCSYRGTETFELDDATGEHGEAMQLPVAYALKADATATTQAEFYQICSTGNRPLPDEPTFFYGTFDNYEEGKHGNHVIKENVTETFKNENGNDYVNVSGKSENVYIFDGDFDVNCVESVTYEFDYRFAGSTSKRTAGTNDDCNIGWFYFFDKEYINNSDKDVCIAAGCSAQYGRLNYWSMYSNTKENATANSVFGKSFKLGEWHHIKVVLTKAYTDDVFTGWTISLYVDGVANSTAISSASYTSKFTKDVPLFGLWGRASVDWSHDIDNVYVHADHELNEDVSVEGAAKIAATCTTPGVYYKSCSVCGIVPEEFAVESLPHTYADVVSDDALKSAATANAFAVYYKSCSVCGVLSEETFEGEWLDDFTDGKLPGGVITPRVTPTIAYESDENRNYINVSGTSELVFYMDGDFDVDCVNSVTYEFDYSFNTSTSKRTSSVDTLAWLYFINPANVSSSSVGAGDASTLGRLGFWTMTANSVTDADQATLAGVAMKRGEWHNVKVVLTKKTDDSGAAAGWTIALYIDGNIKQTSTEAKAANVTSATYVPYLAIWGAYNVTWSYNLDNVRVYADHSSKVEDCEDDDALVRDADCNGPAVYNKWCDTCEYIPSPCLYGEKTDHSYTNVVADSAIKTPANATSPAVYYQSCENCGLVNEELPTFFVGEKDWLAAGQYWPSFSATGYGTVGSADILSDEETDELFLRLQFEDTAKNDHYVNFNHGKIVPNATKYVYEFDYRFVEAHNVTKTVKRIFSSKLIASGTNDTRGGHVNQNKGDNYSQNPYEVSGNYVDEAGNTIYNTHAWGNKTINANTWYDIRVEFTVTAVDETTGQITYSANLYINGGAAALTTNGLKQNMSYPDLAPGLSLVLYGSSYFIDSVTMDFKNVNSYVETATSKDAHSGDSTQIASDEAFISPATKDAPATYYYSYACCGALDYSKTFEYGYVDCLANSESYPNMIPAFKKEPVYDEGTGLLADGAYSYIKEEEDGNYVWRFERQNSTGGNLDQRFDFQIGDAVENAERYVYKFDFRLNSAAIDETHVNSKDEVIQRAFLSMISANGTASIGTYPDGRWEAACNASATGISYHGKALTAGEWYTITYEFIAKYTEATDETTGETVKTLSGYTCNIYIGNDVAVTRELVCHEINTKDNKDNTVTSNAPAVRIYMSGISLKNISFDLDNFVYICEVAE